MGSLQVHQTTSITCRKNIPIALHKMALQTTRREDLGQLCSSHWKLESSEIPCAAPRPQRHGAAAEGALRRPVSQSGSGEPSGRRCWRFPPLLTLPSLGDPWGPHRPQGAPHRFGWSPLPPCFGSRLSVPRHQQASLQGASGFRARFHCKCEKWEFAAWQRRALLAVLALPTRVLGSGTLPPTERGAAGEHGRLAADHPVWD
ncbi:hypothetical protein Anapl_01467 [Anas platyrhynchos]|uniref:Uncharacterized protein n=1 Tax=Anas platyrhynchos TaxID=8839 RepID=R0KE51_ANAPL|nr:hypothetical protein Anapl_01467 [Anas platyrhynchos]